TTEPVIPIAEGEQGTRGEGEKGTNGDPDTLPGPRTIPVAVLPGFPTSAVFTFREFLAPVIRFLAGRAEDHDPVVQARLPFRVNSERGRTEYLLVSLVAAPSSGDPPSSILNPPSSPPTTHHPPRTTH